jgi:hypothetical protein
MQKNSNIKVNNLINSDNELFSITNYISNQWDGFNDKNSSEFFKKVWDTSNYLLRNNFDQYAFLDFIKELYDLKDLPNVKINGVDSQSLPLYFMLSNSALTDVLKKEWDYEKAVNTILSEIKSEFPYASKARPKNWNSMAKNYCDFDGMKDLDSSSLKNLFGGMDSQTAGSYSFEIRTSLPHVMYDDKCQGRKPLEVLIGAMIGHSYIMNERNNSSKMLKEWIELKQKIEDHPGQDITFNFQEPLNQTLFNIIKHEGEIQPNSLKLLGINHSTKKQKR